MDARTPAFGRGAGQRPGAPPSADALRAPERASRIALACRSGVPRAKGFGAPDNAQGASGESAGNSAEALTRTLGELSKRQGRVSQTTNVVLGSDNTEEKWRAIDKKVNEYPSERYFVAIGTGGDSFSSSIVNIVESVVGPVGVDCVTNTPSTSGKYLSVKVGPVWVQNADEVIAVYAAMKEDSRLKWSM